jgi:hypothetical protein
MAPQLDPFDPDVVRLHLDGIPRRPDPHRPARKRVKRAFLIPEAQFSCACRLPGKALAVLLVLLRRSYFERSSVIHLTSAVLDGYGITRWQKEVALRHLERARLIRVRRCNGKNPRVTLLQREAIE